MVACPRCGEENPERAGFCFGRGLSLVVDPGAPEERKVVSAVPFTPLASRGAQQQV